MALAQSMTAVDHLLGDHRRARRVAAPARDAVADPRELRGAAQKKAYALVGAAAAIAAAVGPLLGGFITTYLSWRVASCSRTWSSRSCSSGSGSSATCRTPGPRGIDLVGAVLSVVGMGGIVLGILVWQEGGEAVGALLVLGVVAIGALAWWLVAPQARGEPTLIDPDLFASKLFRLGITGQMLQQIALGGMMIALPIYLQMVFEYNAMQAGLSLAPLSLSMFAVALARREGGGQPAPEQHHPRRLRCSSPSASLRADPDRAPRGLRLVPRRPADRRRRGARAARLAAQQLHARPDLGGARQRGRRRQLGRRVVRPVVRPRVRRRDHARDAVVRFTHLAESSTVLAPGRAAAGRGRARGRRRGHEQHPARGAARGPATGRRRRRSSRSTPTRGTSPFRWRCSSRSWPALVGL